MMFPQGFPQRMRRTAASGPGRWAGGGRRAQRLEEAGSGLTDGKNPMAPLRQVWLRLRVSRFSATGRLDDARR